MDNKGKDIEKKIQELNKEIQELNEPIKQLDERIEKQKERIEKLTQYNDIASVNEIEDMLNPLVAKVDLYKKKQTLNEKIKILYEEIQQIQREIQKLGEGTSRDKLRKKINLQDKVNDLVAKINIYRNEKEIQELNEKIQDLEKQIQDLEKLIRYNNLPFNTKNYWEKQEKSLVKEIDSRNIELNELITKRDNLINDIQPEDDEFNPAQLEEVEKVESDIKKKKSEIRNIEEKQLNHVREQTKDVYRKPYIKVRKLTEALKEIKDQKQQLNDRVGHLTKINEKEQERLDKKEKVNPGSGPQKKRNTTFRSMLRIPGIKRGNKVNPGSGSQQKTNTTRRPMLRILGIKRGNKVNPGSGPQKKRNTTLRSMLRILGFNRDNIVNPLDQQGNEMEKNGQTQENEYPHINKLYIEKQNLEERKILLLSMINDNKTKIMELGKLESELANLIKLLTSVEAKKDTVAVQTTVSMIKSTKISIAKLYKLKDDIERQNIELEKVKKEIKYLDNEIISQGEYLQNVKAHAVFDSECRSNEEHGKEHVPAHSSIFVLKRRNKVKPGPRPQEKQNTTRPSIFGHRNKAYSEDEDEEFDSLELRNSNNGSGGTRKRKHNAHSNETRKRPTPSQNKKRRVRRQTKRKY
jgi:hypothetical protein